MQKESRIFKSYTELLAHRWYYVVNMHFIIDIF
jgi:hypothetical protein